MRRLHIIALVAISIIVLTVPVVAESHMAMAKKHKGPVPFPPDIIPTISHEQTDKNHNNISLNK